MKYGKLKLTHEQFQEIPEDTYNSMIFNEAAFNLFGLSIYNNSGL